MNAEKQRIAIAEACGWRWSDKKFNTGWVRPDGTCGGPPDYLNDLNAMHEAEKLLMYEERMQYVLLLRDATEPSKLSFLLRDFASHHATAAQRAEAFLKTIGKWEE